MYTSVYLRIDASGGLMDSKLDQQTYTTEFESHWVPLSYGLVPHLSKKLSKLPPYFRRADTYKNVITNIKAQWSEHGKQLKILLSLYFIFLRKLAPFFATDSILLIRPPFNVRFTHPIPRPNPSDHASIYLQFQFAPVDRNSNSTGWKWNDIVGAKSCVPIVRFN